MWTSTDGCWSPAAGDARALLRDWRKRRAGEVLTPRVHLWENRMGLNVRSITYTAAKRRWGSMRADGCLRLNAALMHCPMALCDYVIVHELAHLTHPDHSPCVSCAGAGHPAVCG